MARATSPRNKSDKPHKPLGGSQLQAVADLFTALSEPSRLNILQALKDGPLSVGELVASTHLKQSNVSKQLGILLSSGVIQRKQDGNRAIYSIKLQIVFELCSLVCNGIADQAEEHAAALRVR